MEAPPLERKLVAILAADVASYSRLMEIDEEGTLATLSAFRLVTDRLISQHEGRICGTAGDSILAAFGSALAAVQCAVDIQNELAHSNNDIEKDRRMQFRIGINVGDVMLKDGDIFGDGVNIAARLEGLADPGGICISRGIHDHVMKKLPFEFEDLGEQSVKNIAQPVRVYRLLLDERGPELRSSPAARRRQRSRPKFRRFLKASLLRRLPTRRQWKSSSGTRSRTAFSPANTKPISSNILRAASSLLPAFVSRRSRQDAVTMRDPHDREIELSFWESVRESDNPALIRAYLEKYPNGEFSALARIRVDELTPDSHTA